MLIILIIGLLIYMYSNKKIDIVTFITFFSLSLLYRDKIGWEVSARLEDGIKSTYNWINQQLKK